MFTWFVENPWAAWLLILLVLAVVEMFFLEFFCLMLAVGAGIAAITAVLTDNWVVQVLVFAVVSLLLLVLVRPSLMARLHRNAPETKNNADALIGKRVRILETVSDTRGLVRLEGDVWTARSSNTTAIPTGTFARVLRIEGATAVVEPDHESIHQP